MLSANTLLAFAIVIAAGLVVGDLVTRASTEGHGLDRRRGTAAVHPRAGAIAIRSPGAVRPVCLVGLAGACLLLAMTSRWLTPASDGPAYAVAILVSWGAASVLGSSGILACTVAGLAVANLRQETARAGETYLAPFATALFTAFYTLAGLRLDFQHLDSVLWLTLLFFLARAGAKVLSAHVAMALAGMMPTTRNYLGIAMLPHGGVAIGLILVVQESTALAPVADAVTTVGLSALALNQLVGPSMTRLALNRVGETGLDRPRLLDFLTEQNIVIGLDGPNRRDIFTQLARRLRTQSTSEFGSDALVERLLQADASQGTCVGEGLMVPHVSDPDAGPIRGVLGLSSKGLDLGAPDGKAIHAVLVLLIPDAERHHHLEVLAAFATLITARPEVRERLYHARTPAHAHKALNPPDNVGFNYFRSLDPFPP